MPRKLLSENKEFPQLLIGKTLITVLCDALWLWICEEHKKKAIKQLAQHCKASILQSKLKKKKTHTQCTQMIKWYATIANYAVWVH